MAKLELEQDENGDFILSDNLFLVYGEGNTVKEAKKDYVESLVEYCQITNSEKRNG